MLQHSLCTIIHTIVNGLSFVACVVQDECKKAKGNEKLELFAVHIVNEAQEELGGNRERAKARDKRFYNRHIHWRHHCIRNHSSTVQKLV